MGQTWLSLSLPDLAENYAGEELDSVQDYGAIGTDDINIAWTLQARARLEREGFLTDEVKQADAEVIQAASAKYDWPVSAADGDEWPLHLQAIGAGRFPLDRIPEHVRDLAREAFYSNPSAGGQGVPGQERQRIGTLGPEIA